MTTMTLFQTLALTCHRLERWLSRRHRAWWGWKHRNREVMVTYRLDEDTGIWRAKKACEPGHVRRYDEETNRYETMPLREAVEEEGAGICPSCFNDYRVRPTPV